MHSAYVIRSMNAAGTRCLPEQIAVPHAQSLRIPSPPEQGCRFLIRWASLLIILGGLPSALRFRAWNAPSRSSSLASRRYFIPPRRLRRFLCAGAAWCREHRRLPRLRRDAGLGVAPLSGSNRSDCVLLSQQVFSYNLGRGRRRCLIGLHVASWGAMGTSFTAFCPERGRLRHYNQNRLLVEVAPWFVTILGCLQN